MKDDPKVVFVISPLKGDIEANIKQASKYCHQIVVDGDVPIAPHIYTTRFLDDKNPLERAFGMKIGHFMMRLCTEARTFQHALTTGMSGDVLEARDVVGIPVDHMGTVLEPKCEPSPYTKLSRKELESVTGKLNRKLTLLGKMTCELLANRGQWVRTLTEEELDLLHELDVKRRGDSSLLNWGAHLVQEQERERGDNDES